MDQFDRIIVRNAAATPADPVELEPIRLALEDMLRSPLSPPERLRASMVMTQVRAMLMRDPAACDALAASVRQVRDRARSGSLRLILHRDCGTGR